MPGFKNLPEDLPGYLLLAVRKLARQFLTEQMRVDFGRQVIRQGLGLPLKLLAAASHFAFQLPRCNQRNKNPPSAALQLMDFRELLNLIFCPSHDGSVWKSLRAIVSGCSPCSELCPGQRAGWKV